MNDQFPNPYAASQVDDLASPTQPGPDDELFDASAGTRFANLILDYIGVLVFSALFGAMLAVAGAPVDGLAARGVGLLAMIAYYLFWEGLFARTPAKWITGTIVIRADGGGKPGFGQILGRTASRFVPFEAFSFLGGTRGWHDTWSGTRVVKVRK